MKKYILLTLLFSISFIEANEYLKVPFNSRFSFPITNHDFEVYDEVAVRLSFIQEMEKNPIGVGLSLIFDNLKIKDWEYLKIAAVIEYINKNGFLLTYFPGVQYTWDDELFEDPIGTITGQDDGNTIL